MLYAIYARVSTDEQNVEQQKDVIVEFCKSKGYNYRCYVDKAVSGKLSDRPAWSKLVSECEKGKIVGIIVLKIDRITRSLEYAIEFFKWYGKIKSKYGDFCLMSLYDNVDLNTADGYFNFMLKCLLSEYELIQFDIRRRIGIERAKKEGVYKGRKKGSKNKAKYTRQRLSKNTLPDNMGHPMF